MGEGAPQALSEPEAYALHALVLAARPAVIVEFGTSFGYSTIFMASALRDLGSGVVITCEFVQAKAERAASNLQAAGLADVVDVRCGDARDVLSDVCPIDFLFLDGANDLYVPVLEVLEPNLSRPALVVADMSHGDSHHKRYHDYVSCSERDLVTVEVPIDGGLVVSAR